MAAVKYDGSLQFKAGRWIIAGEPYMLIRLKRMFPRVNKAYAEKVELQSSDENDADLLWFMQRFILRISPKDHERLKQSEQRWKARREMVHKIISRQEYQAPPIRDLEISLRDYQRTAIELWLTRRTVLLADDVGVGKTATAIGGVASGLLPAVIVCPTHLPRQWKAEFVKFAPWLNVHIARKGRPYELPAFRNGMELRGGKKSGSPADVLIINYAKLAGWREALSDWAKSIIFDEVQRLSRSKSDMYRAAKAIANSAEFRLGLSATPIKNYGGEIFNVFNALESACIGTREEFLREWGGGTVGQSGEPLLKDPRATSHWLRDEGLMLRRTRAELGRELPPVTKMPHFVDADTEALSAMEDKAVELAKIILGVAQRTGFEVMKASSELDWMLRQATGIAKAPYCADFVRMLVESGEKVVVGLWHREVYSIMNSRLKDLGVVQYSGTESVPAKEAAKKKFVDGSANVMLLSLRSGEGLDGLQKAARIVVFAELDWSYAIHEQFIGRVARDGQESPVMAYFLVSDEGSDPFVIERLGIKREQSERLVNPDSPDLERLQIDPEHIKSLAKGFLARRRGAA